jgi:hypothetical protein
VRSKPAYQAELDEEFRSRIWAQGHITPLQFFRIAAWKSAKGLAPLSLNTEADFRERTETLLRLLLPYRTHNVVRDRTDWDEWEHGAAAMIGSKNDHTGLLGLSGVGYPMATAVLAVLAPESFPVIDIWAVEAVFGTGSGRRTWAWQRSAVYRRYAEHISRSDVPDLRHVTSIHERDQFLMRTMKAGKPIEDWKGIDL